ncbi:dihydroxyacetone kinase family protein [Raineyella sp. LH-20]|uniref:dihydroxyacetone kinase family protein n=1 Tax=Raineyella sp. LH-20 TaxID=3081204 RepID=UPI002953062E|nr:dihydroxyacetone kinase family protein [Raineyella sp. LH-20]WOP19919.1 dihydroxyacetone kinase family protein [Raineyella sp. LH-20]
MTHLVNDPTTFATDSLRGFVAAHPTYVQPVHGGVVRATGSPSGEVSVVVGGGAGHYPAFAGWVGPGMAHGAVCGNVFASPSASQVQAVVRAADNSGGTVLLYGNYAGDVLHFGQGAVHCRAEGADVREIAISDDVASRPVAEWRGRRGIAGDLLVVKAAGAAAATGRDLDRVVAVAERANARTRSVGVAFTGCTLPGSREPLFGVPAGGYALGLGIHGEQGLSVAPMVPATEIARTMVDTLLAEEPTPGVAGYQRRAAVLLNGLGATTYEELFVLYGSVADLLTERGIVIVAPEVGEQVTSLDMAGCSLSLMFLDPELEELWTAPADTPAFRRGAVPAGTSRRIVPEDRAAAPVVEGSAESRGQAEAVVAVLDRVADLARRVETELGRIDAVAGDGDHGQGMVLGSAAAARAGRAALGEGAGARTVLSRAGAAWAEGAGGTSGALWGAALGTVATGLSDQDARDGAELIAAVVAGGRAIQDLGGAAVGDKTMVDAVVPFVERLVETYADDPDLPRAWTEAAGRATEAATRTALIPARLGRARTHGDDSIGTPDPGAVSFALVMAEIGRVLADYDVDHTCDPSSRSTSTVNAIVAFEAEGVR